jgi:hypothetical protein
LVGPYETEVSIYLSEDEFMGYCEAKFPVLVDGDISHTGILNVRQSQNLYGILCYFMTGQF